METFFQGLTALFAVAGLFAVFWNLILFFWGRKAKGALRILVKVDEDTDAAALTEELQRLSRSLIFCGDLRIWLVCPKGSNQEETCRYLARRETAVRVVFPEELSDEVHVFLEEL